MMKSGDPKIDGELDKFLERTRENYEARPPQNMEIVREGIIQEREARDEATDERLDREVQKH